MIRQVRGSVVAAGDNYLIVEAGRAGAGIGLRVFAPEPTTARCLVGDPIVLHTHLHVRENELSLYGFEQEDELAIFEALLGVSGVGPKVALAALGALTPESLRLAVSSQEPGILSRVPGIGKRTAEKVVVELKDKLAPAEGELAALVTALDADAEVIEALTGLGYSVVEAQRALQQIPADATGVEERLRLALSQFGE